MIILICSIDFVNSPQYQQMISLNIGDYETIQEVSVIHLLIYNYSIQNLYFLPSILTNGCIKKLMIMKLYSL